MKSKASILLGHYETFLIKNANQISSIETGLRSLSWIMPGQFQDVEIATESLSSLLQIMGIYHDAVLAKATAALGMDPNNPHNRYTRLKSRNNKTYHRAAVLLAVVRYTELLGEMIAKKRGNKSKWRFILFVEALKSFIRFVIFVGSGVKPLMSPPLPIRDVEPSEIEQRREQEESQIQPEHEWIMPRTRKRLPATNDIKYAELLREKTLKAEDVRSSEFLVRRLPPQAVFAEVLYILRPLLYALLAYRYRNHKRNWTPWAIGFATEFFARRMLIDAYDKSGGSGICGLSSLEQEELARRRNALWWWSLRGVFYDSITRPFLKRITGTLERVPLINLISTIIEDYLYLLDNYHFASSTL